MTAQSSDLVATYTTVPVRRRVDHAEGARAHRNNAGEIVINIGRGDEITLTADMLSALGYVPYYDEAP